MSKVDEFISEILEVCKKRGFSISHEDGHGSFEIVNYSSKNSDWFSWAKDKTEEKVG